MKSPILFTKIGKILEFSSWFAISIGIVLVFINIETLGFAFLIGGVMYFCFSFGAGVGLEGFERNSILNKIFRRRCNDEY